MVMMGVSGLASFSSLKAFSSIPVNLDILVACLMAVPLSFCRSFSSWRKGERRL